MHIAVTSSHFYINFINKFIQDSSNNAMFSMDLLLINKYLITHNFQNIGCLLNQKNVFSSMKMYEF